MDETKTRQQRWDIVKVVGVVLLFAIAVVAIIKATANGGGSKGPEGMQAFDHLGKDRLSTIQQSNQDYLRQYGGQYGDGEQHKPDRPGTFPDRGPVVAQEPRHVPPVLMRTNTGWQQLPAGVKQENMRAAESDFKAVIEAGAMENDRLNTKPLPSFKDAVESGAIEEDPRFRGTIKSSPGYKFQSKPPPTSITSNRFNAYPPLQSGKHVYRVVENQICNAAPLMKKMDTIIDLCDAECSNNNNCIGYSYEFSNGTCTTFGSCDSTSPVQSMLNLYVKSSI